MATKDQVNAFIAKLAAIARKEYLTRDKWVLPSVCIAQAASHNPPEYNGYKVYWEDGAQITPPHDTGIMASV